MKKLVLSIVVVALAAFTFVSCGSKSDPKSVATSFLNARNSLDYETAKKFGTPETGKMIDMMASFSSMIPDSMKNESKKIKVEIKDVKEEGDKATVTYSESIKPGDQTLNLIKKDGKWLVNMTKDDMGPGASSEEGAAPPVEEAVPGNDSVQVNAH
ncbi:MAG TPA: DUF4878 domain-containing protein [Chitinophagaceae bacterium]|jgi:hypothetical protein|nr:DUF4878 domain-containing protein [Chitinophagaceae bacterium]